MYQAGNVLKYSTFAGRDDISRVEFRPDQLGNSPPPPSQIQYEGTSPRPAAHHHGRESWFRGAGCGCATTVRVAWEAIHLTLVTCTDLAGDDVRYTLHLWGKDSYRPGR